MFLPVAQSQHCSNNDASSAGGCQKKCVKHTSQRQVVSITVVIQKVSNDTISMRNNVPEIVGIMVVIQKVKTCNLRYEDIYREGSGCAMI